MSIKTKTGSIVKKADGTIASDCDCCTGGGGSCPTDCAACATTYTVTLSGGTGYDGTYTVTRSGCTWSNFDNPYEIRIACGINGDGILSWTVYVVDGSDTFKSKANVGLASCPPTGSYGAFDAISGSSAVS